MSIFKCKMCGGTIEFEPGATVGECEYCGTRQTLPKLDDDRRANLYDRANHFRRNNEFDKAASMYEQILNEDRSDAEAYWSLVLCHYGIEYVEDPTTHKRIPTVNRAQFTSIFDDDNYKSALEYADISQKVLYEEEANTINEIQKGILAISQKEEPFDVFICYKETDNNGRRTPDSVLANDLYHQLTQEGFKVFFARITLEDKLGTAYEPYIFAALNSAKVMVVLGTKPEYFKAVWVKNEWSRYLALVKNSGGKKVLIPAYRDMDPYDLPEEFSHLQAQDMSKLGFMQDLIRGIKKIVKSDEPKPAVKETVVVNQSSANVAPLLRRAFMCLEDGEWKNAEDYCERVLDQDPENAQAYLGKLMAEQQVHRQEDLPNQEQPFDESNNYQKALRFGDEKFSSTLRGYIDHINERNENARLTGIYNNAVRAMNAANSESTFRSAAATFKTITGFKDADSLAEQCGDKAEICRKDAVYASAQSQIEKNTVDSYGKAVILFHSISGWKDADEQISACQRKIEEIKAQEEADRLERQRKAEEKRIADEKAAQKRKRVIAIATPIIVVSIAFLILLTKVIIPNSKYNSAVELYNAGKYDEAIMAFKELSGYKDSEALITDSKYNAAVELFNAGKYDEAIKAFKELSGYKDSVDKVTECQKLGLTNVTVGSVIKFGLYEQDNTISNGKEEIVWEVLAVEGNKALIISQFALDCQQYDTSNTSVTWESCSLRKWMNGTFYNAAFGAILQEMIISSPVSADNNPRYRTSPGNNTTDKVFLLSINEVEKYFSSVSAQQCQGTAYCYAQGAYKANNGNCRWWLRSPGRSSYYAAFVNIGGSVNYDGSLVDFAYFGVRPALWINLGS